MRHLSVQAAQLRLRGCLPPAPTTCLSCRPRPNRLLPSSLQTLYDAFGVDGRLVVNYALTPAWG